MILNVYRWRMLQPKAATVKVDVVLKLFKEKRWVQACLNKKQKRDSTCFILASSLRVWSSLRRSFLFPTKMMGTVGQKCLTSGVHFSGMFSVKA